MGFGGRDEELQDLLVWEKAHRLTLAVYAGTRSFPVEERFGLTSQLRRACASIPAEGCGRRSEGEMARFIQIAMGSGAEVSSYHLLLARDLGLLMEPDYIALEEALDEVMRMLSSLSSRLRKSLAA